MRVSYSVPSLRAKSNSNLNINFHVLTTYPLSEDNPINVRKSHSPDFIEYCALNLYRRGMHTQKGLRRITRYHECLSYIVEDMIYEN